MFGLGVTELVVILVLALLVFGPRKLPELGSFFGKSLRDFRDALGGGDESESPPNVERRDPPTDGDDPPPSAPR